MKDHYKQLDEAFPRHNIHLDVSIEADQTWDVMAFCAEAFRSVPVELRKVGFDGNRALFFRLSCESHSDIRSLKQTFSSENAPSINQWVVEIGSPAKANARTVVNTT